MLKINKGFAGLEPEGAYLVLDKATELERRGRDIIHLEIGQPDFPTPDNIVSATVNGLLNGETRYTSPVGVLNLRKAIAKKHKADLEGVAVTPSCKTAIFAALSMVVQKGTRVYVPNPGFPSYGIIVKYLGGIVEDYISNETEVIILNSPSNPTGYVMTRGECEEIRKRNCWVITDEIYADIVYGKYTSYFERANRKKTILVSGFSKSYSMTGFRVGYIVFPKRFQHEMNYFLTHTVGCTAQFTQSGALEALMGSQKSVKDMVMEFEKRRDFVIQVLNKIPGVRCSIPGGAFYLFPNISAFEMSSERMADYLLGRGVAVLPGTAFGSKGEGYIRISIATSMEKLTEGLGIIRVALSKL